MTDRLIVRRGYYYIGDIKNGHGNLNFLSRSKFNKAHDFVIGQPNLKSKPD
jgi:hypothetical protein